MRILDAYILARTKRKTRRIRMALVTIVSALLFAVLIFGSFIATGLQQSAGQFKDVGYNGRYLTLIFSNKPPSFDFVATEKDVKAQMDAELRARKIKVDDTVRNGGEYSAEFIRRITALSTAKQQEEQAANEQAIRQEHAPKALYQLNLIDVLQSIQLRTAKDSDPYLTQQQKALGGDASESSLKGDGGFFGQEGPSFFKVEASMLTPLLQPGQSFEWKPGEAYPTLMSYSYVAKIADRSFMNLSSQEKIDAYAQLIKDYTGKELTYCYRNGTAQEQLANVLRYNKQAETDKDSSTKAVGITPCQDFDQALLKKVSIIEEKKADEPKPLFPLPPSVPPLTREVRLKIVGFVPTYEFTPSGDIFSSFFAGVNAWPAQQPMLLPNEIVRQDAFLQTASEYGFMPLGSLFADFETRAEQRKFLESGCSGMGCTANDKLYIVPFGSIKVALEGTFQTIMTVAKWVVLGIAVIAALMITMTISKIIADSRREIAVFRALGARRRDIAQIYFTYGLMLAGSSLVVAIVLAIGGALIFSAHFSSSMNAVMVEAVGAYTMQTNTVLFGVNWLWLAAIAGVLLVASLIGIAIPVLLSNRKNLMNLMRDE